jgi:hypothetical protein
MQDLLSDVGIKSVQEKFGITSRAVEAFAKRCAASAPQSGPVRFMCDEAGRIDIALLDAEISGKPRFIHLQESGFVAEWVFTASNGMRSCSVWKFYIDNDGFLYETIEDLKSSDVQGTYFGEHGVTSYIIGKLVPRLIASSLYAA